jgi:Amidohydrolase family
MSAPDMILYRGLLTTLDRSNPTASAVAIQDGLFTAVGSDGEITKLGGPSTKVIDLRGRRVLPGLIDNHLHMIRGGLNFNMELRWDGVPSLADAMAMLFEEGRKGRIEAGQFADLIVPDRDFFACAESEIADTTSDLTLVGGRIVYGAGDFKSLDGAAPPPAMPGWSPVRNFGGYGNWAGVDNKALRVRAQNACDCRNSCALHGHDHARACSATIPVADLASFWGALGCACWAV